MGLLKKIFKPVSKVLDKIIPNEIKPALPYLAAFAPYFGPTSSLMGKGIMQRALISGGLNIGAQLSQEGNEGDINLLSAGLGALSGAMTAPGAADTFAGSRVVGTGADGKAITASEYAKLSEGANLGTGVIETGGMTADLVPAVTSAPIKGPIPFNQVVQGGSSGITGLSKAKNLALTGLEKGSKFISEGMAGGLKDKAQVLALPAATATGDLMQAEARQLEKQAAIDAALAEAEALADAGLRGDAIRNAMRAYGFFTDDEIESTVSSAGYKAGGRVGFRFGGMEAAIENIEDQDIKESAKMVADMPDMDLMDLIEEFEITFKRKPMNMDELKQFYRENYEMESPVRLKEKIKEKVTLEAKDGGRIGFDEGGDEGDGMLKEIAKIIFRLTPAGAGIMAADEAIEMYNNLSEEDKEKVQSFGKKAMRFAGLPGLAVSAGMELSEKFKEKKMKDGGLMDLGGKEMDLRGGGFVPIGKKERADDVPARLSKNEFVMTADAVRAAGGGSVNKGAKRMYNLMNNLEARA